MIILRHYSNRYWLFADPLSSESLDYIICDSKGNTVKREVLEHVHIDQWVRNKVSVEGWVMELKGLNTDIMLLGQ